MMRSLRFFMLMAVVICSLAVNAQDAIANDANPTATSTVTVLENYGTDVKSENFTLLQHNDTLVSDAELLKSIAEDTSAKRLKKARIFKWTAWVGGSVYGAQNEAYMSRLAEKWVSGLCFNELGVCD